MTSLVVQWLGLHTSSAGGVGLIPGWGTNIPHVVWRDQQKQTDFLKNPIKNNFKKLMKSIQHVAAAAGMLIDCY